jgi:hypothetical protein
MTSEPNEADRIAAADLARMVYGARTADGIADGTIEHHHFMDALARHRQASEQSAALRGAERMREAAVSRLNREWPGPACEIVRGIDTFSAIQEGGEHG